MHIWGQLIEITPHGFRCLPSLLHSLTTTCCGQRHVDTDTQRVLVSSWRRTCQQSPCVDPLKGWRGLVYKGMTLGLTYVRLYA